jgi:beta-lactamase class D
MRKLFIIFCLFGVSLCALAEDADMARLFKQAGIEGTIVIESVNGGQRFVHNDLRAKQQFTAASTFKILNTLIALDQGVITEADSVIPWDGTQYEIADWNQDQTLRSAFRVSCVWCYQALAMRVGAHQYPAYINDAHYGRLSEPFNGRTFWLDGSLVISAEQQVAFLKAVVTQAMNFSTESYKILESIMLIEDNAGYRLYAKTGWATQSQPATGWFVGYVVNADDTWLFALNLDTRNAADLPLRRQIALDALRAKGILPAG